MTPKLCSGRVFAACFTAKLIITSYLASGIHITKTTPAFHYWGDIMQIINSPIHTWTYLSKPHLQDLQQIPIWEYGLVTSNRSGGPLNQVTSHHGLRHIPELIHLQGTAQSSSICSDFC